ncbi:MAG: thioredoxin family protein, partial [bacterium]|nr:thioredoxin family protein [bacterium]
IIVRCFPRDENLDVMDMYLTNGGRAIPKFVVYDSEMKELAQWGARPAGAQAIMLAAKAEGDTVKEYWPKVVAWYQVNHPAETYREWEELFRRLPQ